MRNNGLSVRPANSHRARTAGRSLGHPVNRLNDTVHLRLGTLTIAHEAREGLKSFAAARLARYRRESVLTAGST
jgi:hypothetical protein